MYYIRQLTIHQYLNAQSLVIAFDKPNIKTVLRDSGVQKLIKEIIEKVKNIFKMKAIFQYVNSIFH